MRVRFQAPPLTTQGLATFHEHEASPASVAATELCAPKPMRPHRVIFGQGAASVAVLVVAAGCASLDPQVSKAWKVEPVMNVNHVVQSSEGYYQLGRHYDGMQTWDKSIDAYRKAIAADERNVEAYNGLGVALAQRGRLDEAGQVLREAIALDPNRSHLHSNLGYVLMLANRPHDAVRALRVALKLDRNDATALANLREAVWRNELAQNQADPEARELLATMTAATPTAAVPKPAATVATVNVAAPITSVDLPLPPTSPVSSVAPLGAILPTAAAAPALAAAAVGRATTEAPAAPTMALQVVDRPTAAPLIAAAQVTVAPTAVTMVVVEPAQPVLPRAGELLSVVPQSGGLQVRQPTLVTRPDASTMVAAAGKSTGSHHSQLELSNGNGVPGMAARLRSWLGVQGVATNRLTNQRPFTQPHTVVHYRAGHEQSALRVVRALPASAQAIETPDINPRVDVRVVIGRDWVHSAACLNTGGCQAQGTNVAQSEVPGSRARVVPVNFKTRQ